MRNNQGMKRFRFSVLILAGCFSAVATADVLKPFTIAMIQEWSQFNPVNNQLASTTVLMNLVVRQMVRRTSQGTVVPDLAEEVPNEKNKKVKFVTEKGTRKAIASWSIKAKAKWGDGKDITCADWWQGWQAGLNPHVAVDERQPYSKIEKIEWKEDAEKNCTVTYTTDSWTFDRDLPELLPQHLEGAIFEKYKGEKEGYDRNSLYVKDPTNPGLYSGPYIISKFELGSHFILKPNPHFYGEKPNIENIVVKHIGDTSSLRAHLMAGAVDMISSNGLPADMALALDEESKKDSVKFQVKFQDSPMFQGLFLNLENELLKKIEVRKALSLAIPKRELTKAFFKGKIFPAERIFALQSPAYEEEKESYSPALARKTLEAAGWKMGSKNIYEKGGKELILEFMTSAGIKTNEMLQVFICDNFLKVGIKCAIKNQAPRVFLGQTVPRGEFTLGLYGLGILPDSSLNSFSSTEIPTSENGWAGSNGTRWRSTKADELLNKVNKEWDFKKRAQLLRDLGREIQADIPIIPIYHRREALVLPKKLRGLTADVSGAYFIFPEKWRL
ncbi:MAG: peptide ABC transporter substrate-binding protein [Pseudobdellovibrionaceae bacterium]